MAYGDFKDLPRRTASDKILHDKAFNIAQIPKYDRFQRELDSLVYTFFDKKSSNGAVTRAFSVTLIMRDKSTLKSEIIPSQELAQESEKTIIRKFVNQRVYSSSKHNIRVADIADG